MWKCHPVLLTVPLISATVDSLSWSSSVVFQSSLEQSLINSVHFNPWMKIAYEFMQMMKWLYFVGGQYHGWACRNLSNRSFWERRRNISPDQKTKKQMFRGLKIWSPRISMLFSGNHYVEEIAPACPAARLFLTCLVQLGEFPSRRLPVRHPSVWGPYALCFPGSEAQCRAALTDWLVKYGEQTYYDRLSRALQHIGRTDVAMGEYLIRGGNKHVLKSRVTGREATVLMRCKLECGRSQRRPLRKKQSWTSERIILGHGSEFAKIRVHFRWRRPPRDLDNIE